MFEKILSRQALKIITPLADLLSNFYLAGGTGLALQLGHRKSADFDFFSTQPFEVEALCRLIKPNKILLAQRETLHCEKGGLKLSILFYEIPLMYPTVGWRNFFIADWRDITAEKFKAVSQRGARKDFIDLFAILQSKLSIREATDIFKRRFFASGINHYHVLKSLLFFEQADKEPAPRMLWHGKEWQWRSVKKYFEANIREFYQCLLQE